MLSSSGGLDVSQGVEAYPIAYNYSFSTETSQQDIFKYVKTNVPGPGINKNTFSEQFAGCDCDGVCTISTCSCLQIFGCAYDDSGKLKMDILKEISSKPILECGHACSCDLKSCSNRTVQQGIQKRFHIFHTKDKGYGLKLDSRNESGISRLSYVCEYAGEVIGQEEARLRMKQTDMTGQSNYLIALREHVSDAEMCTYIDPRYIGNVGRFINHSCDPNLFMVPVRVNHNIPRLALFARKNIKAGEELTFDYSGNATFDVSSDSTTEVEPVNSNTHPLHSDTQNSSGNIYMYDTLTDKLVHDLHPHETKADLTCGKKMKFCNTACNPDVYTSIQNNENVESHDSCSHGDKNVIEETWKLKEPESEIMADTITSNVGADNPVTRTAAFVRRKPCFCGSHNCTGVLPLDSQILYD